VTSRPAGAQHLRALARLRHVRDRIDRDHTALAAGDAVVRSETGDETGQESRSAGHRAATSVTVMDITLHGGMHWITVGPADQPGTSISGLPVRF
jgi:hypothetical protein